MAGIYIHIPFCKQACHYCNFHFSTSLATKNDFLEALLQEISLQNKYLKGEKIESLYIGGGTPSLLTADELSKIAQQIRSVFELAPEFEFTLEANPDDLNEEKLMAFKSIGVNRLSIGIQSFFDEDLLFMNRSHHANQAIACIQLAQQQGIHNISIDLIFGFPLLTFEKLVRNVDILLSLNIPHVSCYAMTVEPKTALAHMVKIGKVPEMISEQAATHFEYISERLRSEGYEHYEISNYAKKGNRSKHNSSYWKGISYVGLGPSAHSYNGHSRQWNVSNNSKYIQSIQMNKVPCEVEILNRKQIINEKVMISLRTMEGLLKHFIESNLTQKELADFNTTCHKYVQCGWLQEDSLSFKLTTNGALFADLISCELFV